MNLFYTSLQLKGFPISEARVAFKSIQESCKINVLNYQEERAWQIFKHHLSSNAAYASWIGNRKISTWHDIPIMTKSSIQVDVAQRLSAGYTPKNTHLHNTSGSSGTPFFFAKDKFCHALSWALIEHRFGLHDITFGKDLQARFYGIPLSKWKYRKEKLKDSVAARVRFPVFDLSDKVLASYVTKFRKHNFSYVNGYTSSLVLMAKYCIQQKITLKEICPSLKAVFTTSEVCDALDKKMIEQGFGVKAVNEYGAAELDLIGFEDAAGNFLLTHETQFIEIVDDEDKPTQPGQEGRVIITSLYNKAMPFIRYELGDRLVLKKEQHNAYQLIDRIVGRTNDIAFLPSGKKSPGLTFYYISKSLLEGGGFMKEFVIKQKSLSHFHFEYVAHRDVLEDEIQKVVHAMDTYLEPGLTATFERKEKIERTTAGKLKQFFSEINEEALQ